MNRLLSILSLTLCLFLLCACGTGTAQSTEPTDTSTVPTTSQPDDGIVSLDRKRVIFIGNSYIYYGGTVNEMKQSYLTQTDRLYDVGYFYQLCKANDEEVVVSNWTFGGHSFQQLFGGNCDADRGCNGVDHLSYLEDLNYDYVILSENSCAGNSEAFPETMEWVMSIFRKANPDVQFVYLCHSSSHGLRLSGITQPNLLNHLKELEAQGVKIVDWGKITSDLASGAAKIEGSTIDYNFYSFIIRKSETDGFHPNQLSGYITTLMTYCAITGKSPVGQPYSFVGDTSLSQNAWNRSINSYISQFYSYEDYTTNYNEVFASETEMEGLQKLIEQYMTEKPHLTYNFATE